MILRFAVLLAALFLAWAGATSALAQESDTDGPADCGAYQVQNPIEEPNCGSPGELPEGVYDSGEDGMGCPEGFYAADGPNTLCVPVTKEDFNNGGVEEPKDMDDSTEDPDATQPGFGSVYVDTGDGSGLNCRADPNNGNMTILTTIPYGEVVYWMSGGGGDNPWARVAWTGYDCFVDVGYLSYEIPAAITAEDPDSASYQEPESAAASSNSQSADNEALVTAEDPEVQVTQSPVHGPADKAESQTVHVAVDGLPATGTGPHTYMVVGGKIDLPDESGRQPSITPQQREAIITVMVLISTVAGGFLVCRAFNKGT